MNRSYLNVSFYILLLILPISAHGQSSSDKILFDKAIELEFTPTAAYFFILFADGTAVRKRATIVPPFRSEGSGPGKVKGKWLFGTRAAIPADTNLIENSLLITGDDGRFAFMPPEERKRDSSDMPLTTDALKEHLKSRKEVLRTLETQFVENEKKLRRLRADVDTIADIGKIVEAREETIKIKKELQNLEKDKETLTRSLKLVRSRPNPKNFMRREGELTSQLSQLVDAAKKLESAELSKQSSGESRLKRKLALIEQTRGVDVGELEKRLDSLTRRRLELEASL